SEARTSAPSRATTWMHVDRSAGSVLWVATTVPVNAPRNAAESEVLLGAASQRAHATGHPAGSGPPASAEEPARTLDRGNAQPKRERAAREARDRAAAGKERTMASGRAATA